jgi:hypothetical protein
MQVGISDEERDALIAFLRERINSERLPRSSRLPLKRFLSKIEPVHSPRRKHSTSARNAGDDLTRTALTAVAMPTAVSSPP